MLARPRFKFDPERTRHILAKLEQDGIPIRPGDEPLDLPDSDDEPFLAVALTTSADYLVTGNVKDYPPAKRRGCAVVSPAEFIRIWSQLHPEPPPAPK